MRWQQKLAIDTIKAAIPCKPLLRRVYRRFRPYQTDPSNDAGLLYAGLTQIAALQRLRPIAGAVVLEFGSGWLPVAPLLFRFAGAASVTLTDQERLLDDRLWEMAAGLIMANGDRVESALGAAPRRGPLLDRDAFRYLVPFDPAAIPSGSVDIITSRSVLEHVRPRDLARFMAEFHRILKPDGLMCHDIDLSDHWGHKDKSISRVNFLRYSDSVWWLTCLNPQNYQNRLRMSEYVALIREVGFTIRQQTTDQEPATLAALSGMRLAPRFAGFAAEDLAAIGGHIIAAK